jgi:hypothetical protein
VTEEFAMMITLVTLILTVGFVAVVRPIAKPLVRLIEAMIQERQPGSAERQLGGIRSVLKRVEDRIGMLEDRQSFYEALGDGERTPQGALPRAAPSLPEPAKHVKPPQAS